MQIKCSTRARKQQINKGKRKCRKCQECPSWSFPELEYHVSRNSPLFVLEISLIKPTIQLVNFKCKRFIKLLILSQVSH